MRYIHVGFTKISPESGWNKRSGMDSMIQIGFCWPVARVLKINAVSHVIFMILVPRLRNWLTEETETASTFRNWPASIGLIGIIWSIQLAWRRSSQLTLPFHLLEQVPVLSMESSSLKLSVGSLLDGTNHVILLSVPLFYITHLQPISWRISYI